MGSWDEHHRLRLRAERALVLLRELWGDAPPPGRNGELITLIDAIAGDDANGHRDHLVCQVDGLTYEAMARLLLLAPLAHQDRDGAGADAGVVVPPSLLARLQALGLLDVAGSRPVASSPGSATGAPVAHGTPTGVWELDPATGIVAFDDVAAQLIGAGEGLVTRLVSQGRVIHNPTDASPRLTGFITLDQEVSTDAGGRVLLGG